MPVLKPFVLSLAFALAVCAAGAQQPRPKELVPAIGETREQFEARRRGLPPPEPAGTARLQADRLGHFVADAVVNGEKVRMLVDTGASFVSLSRKDAELLGLKPAPREFTYRMSTANGVVTAAPVRLSEVQVGDVALRNVEAVVHAEGGPSVSLLGMSFLKRLAAFETVQGRLVLRQ